MSQTHLTKLFSAFGILLLVILLNSWLATQGANAILKLPLLHEERPATAFLALGLGSVLLTLTALVGSLHARRHGADWHSRIPCVWLEDLETATWEGSLYQAVIGILFVALPLLSFWHFAGVVWKSWLCELDTAATPLGVSQAWLHGIPAAVDQIRLVDGLRSIKQPNGSFVPTCTGGIQVFPGWEFVLLMVMVAASAVSSLAFAYAVLLVRASKKPSVAPELT